VTRGTTEPAHRGDDRTAVLGFLQRQRDLVAWKVGGASDEVLRSASTPTGLTAHGLVRHLTNVERWWLRHEFAGETGLPYDGTEDDPRADQRWTLVHLVEETARHLGHLDLLREQADGAVGAQP